MDISPFKLILFDIDGTLRDFQTGAILAGVETFFKTYGKHKIALVTNQGGVGLRYWMEKDGFGQPDNYPDEPTITAELEALKGELIALSGDEDMGLYVCYAYQSKKSGKWSPVPDGKLGDPEWDNENRKPKPGMLLRAMAERNLEPHECLMVGDSDEDYYAAMAANINFEWADTFFDRDSGFGAV